MSKAKERLSRLLQATEALHRATPALTAFAPWPRDLRWADKAAADSPVIKHLRDWYDDRPGLNGALHRALKVAAPHGAWQQTYSVEEVGEDYLNNYGYIELFGPTGHFRTQSARGFLGYWGPGLVYDWHRHEAEEIYAVISGGAIFRSEGLADARLKPGGTHHHAPNQLHAITVKSSALVVYSIWKGAGMAGRASLARTPPEEGAAS